VNATVKDVMTTHVVAVRKNVEGVVAVRDRLSYPDERPVPGRA
jgi:uncharacterized lipoprotein YbaY